MAQKKIEDATLEDFIEVLKDRAKCGHIDCNDCKCDSHYWGTHDGCGKILTKLCRAVLPQIKELMELKERPSLDMLQQNQPNPSIYGSTIRFMKSHGYNHCYMCGADLTEDKDG